ncbi:phosphatase PAP2 family protein [Candidatus Woesearchaeota archaeon]|nr:phosphatase PAP2 family protein [Candidatus Woesearchaeota archaeon]
MKTKNIIFYSAGIILLIISFFLDKLVLVSMVRNPILDYALGSVTHFGSVFIVLIVMTSLFLWQERKREWIPVLWVSFLASSILCLILKSIIARPRPEDLVAAHFIISTVYSFPSLHASASFTAIPILDLEFPKLKWFWVLFAVIVAFSRIYLNVHYLSDVIGGALLGFAVAHFFVFIEKKHKIFQRIKIFRR